MGATHRIRNHIYIIIHLYHIHYITFVIIMGQSLVNNYLHIVFSTKHRAPLIDSFIENDLYSYMFGICKKLECDALIIGGYVDHVHILCRLSKKIALMKLLEELKGHSSKYIKTRGAAYANFYWQDGYGAFSVAASALDKIFAYIANQKQHHTKATFQNEYRGILIKCNAVYDERYVWD
jgi:putative transposase